MPKFIVLLAALTLSSTVCAKDTIIVKDAWVRVPVPGAQVAAAYMTLEASEPLSLLKVTSTEAQAVEIHSMTMKNGVMEMREMKALELKPGQPVKLQPGGLHLMLVDLKKPLKAGDTVQLVLNFGDGKHPIAAKAVTVPVRTTP